MYIGIDIGGTSIKYGLVSEEGDVMNKSSIPTSKNKNVFIKDILNIITRNIEGTPEIKAVGISAPGIIEKNGYFTTAGSLKAMYGVNLKVELEKHIQIPIQIENDANAAAIAERWIGNAQGIDNYLCVVLGTGVGGGIVINGDIYRGHHGMAGEFGWMIIDELPEKGNIETASINQRAAIVGGLCMRYNQVKKAENSEFEDIYDARIIFEQEMTDSIAKQVIEQFFRDLSIGLINLISIFDPEVVLIGGGISENNDFFTRLQKELVRWEQRHDSVKYLMGKTIAPIKQTKLKNDAGIVGAVYPIRRSLKLKTK